MLFVNPTALDWADAKGESLGTKGGFSWAARNSQTLAEMLGVRAPLLSALSCGALQTFPRTPVPRGGLCQLFPSRVSRAHWSLLAPGVPTLLVPVRTECGTRNVGTRCERGHLAAFAANSLAPGHCFCPWAKLPLLPSLGKAPCLLLPRGKTPCLLLPLGKAPCLLLPPLLLLALEGSPCASGAAAALRATGSIHN